MEIGFTHTQSYPVSSYLLNGMVTAAPGVAKAGGRTYTSAASASDRRSPLAKRSSPSIAFTIAQPYRLEKTGGVTVRIRGKEPTDGGAEMMYTAMQVCLTNAIQHANATEISVNIWENEYSYTVMIRPSSQADMAGQGLAVSLPMSTIRFNIFTTPFLLIYQLSVPPWDTCGQTRGCLFIFSLLSGV